MPREDTFCPDSRHRLRLLGILTESREFRIPPQSPRVLMRMAVRAAKDGEPNFSQCLQLLSCRSETGIEMLSDLSFSAGWKKPAMDASAAGRFGAPRCLEPQYGLVLVPHMDHGSERPSDPVPPVKLPASAGREPSPGPGAFRVVPDSARAVLAQNERQDPTAKQPH